MQPCMRSHFRSVSAARTLHAKTAGKLRKKQHSIFEPIPRQPTSSRPANGYNIPWQQGIPRQLLPLALPVHHDGLLRVLKGPQFPQVTQPLSHHSAFKHDQHGQRKEGVVPAPTSTKGISMFAGHTL